MRLRLLSLKYIWWLSFFLVITFGGNSQETSSLFLLPGVSQSSFFNPAIQNENEKLIVGMPFLSGIYGNWNANVSFDALFSKGFSYSVSRLYDELEPRGEANATGRIFMFYASLKQNDYTLRLSVSERVVGTGAFDRDLVKFIRDGIKPYYGTNKYFGKADIHFQHFRELSFSVSKRVWESLDVGIASKILFGKLMLDGSEFELSVKTLQNDKTLLIKPDGNYIASGPFQLYNQNLTLANIYPGDYFFQPRNLGFAVDFGAVYRPNELSVLSISLLDLGFTSFKYNTFDIDFLNPARYSENELFQSNYPDSEDYLEPREALIAFSDSLSDIIDSEDAENRTLMLMPVKVNFLAEYQFSGKITGGINNQFAWLRNQPLNLFSAFIQTRSDKRVQLAGSLSVLNFSAVRPGFGISWTLPKFQFYFSSNNILGIIQPTSSKHLNLSLGMNLLFDTQK